MSPDELLLMENPFTTEDPETVRRVRTAFGSQAAGTEREHEDGGPRAYERDGASPHSVAGAQEVPPVRTIVLDRPPVPVAPPVRERNPLREPAPSTAGPERLRVSDLSIAYAGVPAVKSVSLSIHRG